MEIQFQGKKHAFNADMAALRRVEACLKDKGKKAGLMSLIPHGENAGENIILQMPITDWYDFICVSLDIEPDSKMPNWGEVSKAAMLLINEFMGEKDTEKK